MPIPKLILSFRSTSAESPRPAFRAVLGLFLVLLTMLGSGCGKDTAAIASDSDANGYLCGGCNAKLYTERTVFIDPKCPKCQQDKLQRVLGYWCEKDQHMTIRPDRGERLHNCERCQTNLQNSVHLPREKALIAWGATKASP